MSLPKIASHDEWVAARKALLLKEKAATKQRDRLNAERRELPMVEVRAYEFDGPLGAVSLLDLFEGRRQLIIYHFMFHPEWEDGCPSCTAGLGLEVLTKSRLVLIKPENTHQEAHTLGAISA